MPYDNLSKIFLEHASDVTIPLDTRQLNRVGGFDSTKGHIEVEAGIQWPVLILIQAGDLGNPLKAVGRTASA